MQAPGRPFCESSFKQCAAGILSAPWSLNNLGGTLAFLYWKLSRCHPSLVSLNCCYERTLAARISSRTGRPVCERQRHGGGRALWRSFGRICGIASERGNNRPQFSRTPLLDGRGPPAAASWASDEQRKR